MINRILKPISRNRAIETLGTVWTTCMKHNMEIDITEETLQNMCVNQLTFGLFSSHENVNDRETLEKLAYALGLYGIKNPESDSYGIYPRTSLKEVSSNELLKSIEKELGFPITFARLFTGGMVRQESDFGRWSIRQIHYLWMMKKILELCPNRNSRIIEVGAGIGVLGFYLDKLGYKDYTIVDLARVNAGQAYYLSKNLPERNFILSGEVKNPFEDIKSIKILHTSDFNNVPTGRYDLMVNIDGLTEYPVEDAKRYIHSDCAPMLLSINHEVNPFRVIEIAEPYKHLVYRTPFWLRDGYVEELYKA